MKATLLWIYSVLAIAVALVTLDQVRADGFAFAIADDAEIASEDFQENPRLRQARIGGPKTPDGDPIQVELPGSLHMRNTGGSDGAGLCVFTSINMASYWQNVTQLFRFQEFMRSRPGGGYPTKVDRMIDLICAEQHTQKPKYVQIESNDLEILKLACRTGRACSVTYGFSPTGRYGGQRIAHMVNLMHADDKWFCVLDNNFPGENAYEWMSPKEFLATYRSGSQRGWAVIFEHPGPPPMPWRHPQPNPTPGPGPKPCPPGPGPCPL